MECNRGHRLLNICFFLAFSSEILNLGIFQPEIEFGLL